MNLVFATYESRPELTASDKLVADWLTSQGHQVRGIPWARNIDEFSDCDLVVLRSTWDYTQNLERFLQWLEEVSSRLPIANPIELVKWNANKRYLFDLAEKGFKTPRASVLEQSTQIDEALESWSSCQAVIKPLVGASGRDVERVRMGEIHIELEPSKFLIQEFVPEIEQGELSLAFFGGRFSHAVIKVPVSGEFRINAAYGGDVRKVEPPKHVIDQAVGVLDSLEVPPLYARVDGVLIGSEFMIFELELIEPSFYFLSDPTAARNFGLAIVDYVEALG